VVRENLLDARLLEPPEPFVRACAILQGMKSGEYLRMRHRRVPYPLFDFCRDLGLCYTIINQDDIGCELVIYFESDSEPLKSQGVL